MVIVQIHVVPMVNLGSSGLEVSTLEKHTGVYKWLYVELPFGVTAHRFIFYIIKEELHEYYRT